MRMYHGDYLNDNLGHEIINLFATDNNEHYIYAPAYGVGHSDVQYAFFVYFYPGTNGLAEILGYASDLTIFDESKNPFDKIKYGNQSIDNIFHKDQSILITYKAGIVKRAKKKLFIQFGVSNNAKEKILPTEKEVTRIQKRVGQYLTSYIDKDEDYKLLINLMSDRTLWEDTLPKVKLSEINIPNKTFMEICHKDYDELAYSNAIAYFLRKYPEILKLWMSKHGISIDGNSVKIAREIKNIDLLIYDKNNVIVIENKILASLSNINKQAKTSQLNKYQEIIEKNIKGLFDEDEKAKYLISESLKGARAYYYILIPNYYSEKSLDVFIKSSEYKILKYQELYEICQTFVNKQPCSSDLYFKEFTQMLRKHTNDNDDSLFVEMKRRFYKRISQN